MQKVLAAGGKYAQAADGRIIEYYICSSDKIDAKVFLQISGSLGTARIFPKLRGIVDRMIAENVKGIAISVPVCASMILIHTVSIPMNSKCLCDTQGHGLSSNQPDRRIGDWAKDDVEAVFAQVLHG